VDHAYPTYLTLQRPPSHLKGRKLEVPLITAWHRPTENIVLQLLLHAFPWKRVYLRRRYRATTAFTCLLNICCLAANVVSLFVSRSLSGNSSTCYNMIN
jgi:hypothetical protein